MARISFLIDSRDYHEIPEDLLDQWVSEGESFSTALDSSDEPLSFEDYLEQRIIEYIDQKVTTPFHFKLKEFSQYRVDFEFHYGVKRG